MVFERSLISILKQKAPIPRKESGRTHSLIRILCILACMTESIAILNF